MQAFVEVAKNGSFAAASVSLNMSTSSVSRLVNDLEEWLETPLLRRSTRQISLTDAGTRYLAQCRAIVDAWDSLQQDAKGDASEPRGMLRVAGAAYSVRRMVAPHIPEFLQSYPEIQVHLDLFNEAIDLVAEAADVALRLGNPGNNSLIAKKCGDVELHLTASPAFAADHGLPNSLIELASFPCLLDTTPKGESHWPIEIGAELDYVFHANDGEIIRNMAIAGMGISMLPSFLVEEDIAEGRLLRVLPNEVTNSLAAYIVLPERRQILPAARAFADFMSARIRASTI